LLVEVTYQVGQALRVERDELRRVGLPGTGRAVDVVERVADLMHHHVGGRRRAVAHDDLAVAVRSGADVPGGPAGGQLDPLQMAHVVQVRDAAGADVDAVQFAAEQFLERVGQLGQALHGADDLGRGRALPGVPLPVDHLL